MLPLFLYNCLLSLLAIPLLPWVGILLLLRPRYRLGLTQRLGILPAAVKQCTAGQAPFWLHGPSVGEILATRPFLQALRRDFPDHPILLSVLTPTAYLAAQAKLPEADAVIYFPVDYPVIVSSVLNQVRPAAFFFTETEIWPNFLSVLVRRQIPAFLVSGRFSVHALTRYRLLHPLFRPIFQHLTLCCMQTSHDAARVIAAGVPAQRVVVTGNFKVDGTSQGTLQGQRILQEAGLAHRPLFIAASTHAGEEEILLHTYRKLLAVVPEVLLLLAPRHPQRFAEVERLLKAGGYRYRKRSQTQSQETEEVEVFLLDTLGELASFYPSAALAFVGGSLVKGPGGHSVIEPALAQVPVSFGPYMRNFAAVVEELVQKGGGSEVRDAHSLYEWALPLLTDPRARQEAGRRAYEVVKQGQGAVERTIDVLRHHLQKSARQSTLNPQP
jgi:3-deoxy-D-manno-octulosonic-acid transferase